jgi:hypothetical protein
MLRVLIYRSEHDVGAGDGLGPYWKTSLNFFFMRADSFST